MSTTAAYVLAQAPMNYTWVVLVLLFFAVLLAGVIGMAVLAERSRRRARVDAMPSRPGPGGKSRKRRGGNLG